MAGGISESAHKLQTRQSNSTRFGWGTSNGAIALYVIVGIIFLGAFLGGIWTSLHRRRLAANRQRRIRTAQALPSPYNPSTFGRHRSLSASTGDDSASIYSGARKQPRTTLATRLVSMVSRRDPSQPGASSRTDVEMGGAGASSPSYHSAWPAARIDDTQSSTRRNRGPQGAVWRPNDAAAVPGDLPPAYHAPEAGPDRPPRFDEAPPRYGDDRDVEGQSGQR